MTINYLHFLKIGGTAIAHDSIYYTRLITKQKYLFFGEQRTGPMLHVGM